MSQDGLLLNIISFNVGVEMGQVSALALMLLAIFAWRKTPAFEKFSLIANYGLILAGCLLFLTQIHGYQHASRPEEFTKTARAPQKVGAVEPVPVESSQPTQQGQWKDSIRITIPASGNLEYKFEMVKGATLEYAWETGGVKLFFDFHGEPAGDTTGYFESFQKSTDSESRGSLTAPFDGIHGWYWKNSSPTPVIVTLKARGEYKRLDQEE